MKRIVVVTLHITICFTHVANAEVGGMGCLPPEEPFPYKLSKSDPLYGAARSEHQAYLEGLEGYIKCLDGERSFALAQLKMSFRQFMQNFGKDAVFHYPSAKIERK